MQRRRNHQGAEAPRSNRCHYHKCERWKYNQTYKYSYTVILHSLVHHSISKLAIYASLWSCTSQILYAATNADMAATPVAALRSVSGVELQIRMTVAVL